MGGIAVQVDVQLGPADGVRLVAAVALEERRALAVGDVVAQRAVARGVQHVARMLLAQRAKRA